MANQQAGGPLASFAPQILGIVTSPGNEPMLAMEQHESIRTVPQRSKGGTGRW